MITAEDSRLESRVLIVGAGEAGVAAAAALRDGGHKGPVTLVNGEATLPYARPPLSKDMLVNAACGVTHIQPERWYDEQRIKLLHSTIILDVRPASSTALIRDHAGQETVIDYDKLLFATGSCARRMEGLGDDILYLRTFDDLQNLKAGLADAKSIAIIGGGVIGLELAASARALGKQVTILESADRLMGRALAPVISDILYQLHRKNGVDVRLGVDRLSRDGPGRLTANGRLVEADLIIAGVGSVPNSDLAARAGCSIANGILVDHWGRTDVAGLYAAGDVAEFDHPLFDRTMRLEAWQHAGRHGAHVGRAMLGQGDVYREVPWFWTDQFGLNVQVAGLPHGADRTLFRGVQDRGLALHFAGDRLVAASAVNNGRDIRPATKLIEAGWSGEPMDLMDESRPFAKLVSEILGASRQPSERKALRREEK